MDAQGLENKALAQVTGKSTSTVTQWKNGYEIHTEDIVVICPVIGCSADYLLLGHESASERTTEAHQLIEGLSSTDYQAVLHLLRRLSG